MYVFLLASILAATSPAGPSNTVRAKHEALLYPAVTPGEVLNVLRSRFSDSHVAFSGAKEPPAMWQRTIAGPCRTLATVRREMRRAFESERLDQISVMQEYPRNTLSFLAEAPAHQIRTLVIASFVVTSGGDGQCAYHLAVAYTSHSGQKKRAEASRYAQREMKRLAAAIPRAAAHAIEAVIATCGPAEEEAAEPKAPALAQVFDRLTRLKSHDVLWSRAADVTLRRLAQLPGYPAAGVDFFIVPEAELRALPSVATSSCRVAGGPKRPIIVCSAELLRRTETVIRLLEAPNPFVMSDEGMFTLVDVVDDRETLARLRSDPDFAALADQTDDHIATHLEAALLFYVAHELGHIVDGTLNQQLDSDDAPLRTRRAIVKLCRHAAEFWRNGFVLPGLDEMLRSGSETRTVADQFRTENAWIEAAVEESFISERFADEYAADAMLGVLRLVREEEDRPAADQYRKVVVETLYVLALHEWYRDLWTFGSNECENFDSVSDLSFCIKEVDDYQAANAVFGDAHGFTLLRAFAIISAIVAEEMGYFIPPRKDRTIWPTVDPATLSPARLAEESARFGTLQRHAFLAQIVDTALKFAYAGCQFGLHREIGDVPAFIFFDFYSLESEMQRLRRHP